MADRPNAADEQAELLRQMAELRADVARLTASLGAAAQGRAESLLDQVQSRVAELGGAAEAAVKDRVAGAEEVLEQASDYARRKPLHALGLALGAGMVFGALFGRR